MPTTMKLAAALLTALTVSVSGVPAPPEIAAKAQQCKSDNTFDYVVIGGGTAGLTIAARLAERSSLSVAVIEAGGFYEDNGNVSATPAYWTQTAGSGPDDSNPLVDWGFVSTPQTGLNRRIHVPRGKCLGGSSARNAMTYHRPTVGTFDKWATEVGDDSYRFDRILPYFKKSVQYNEPIVPYANSSFSQDPQAFSSTGGPLQLSYGKWVDAFTTWVQAAVEKLGYERLPGLASGKLIGSGYISFTIDPVKSQRSSSENTFLASALKTTKLQVYRNTLVEKILFRQKRAMGVRVFANNKHYTLRARKEVILSAGAIQSPQMLMVSGVGPKATLQKLDIPVIQDLPGVGQNYGDHVQFAITRPVNLATFSSNLNNITVFNINRDLYNKDGSGPLSIPLGGLYAWEKLPEPLRSNQLSRSSRQAFDTSFPSDWPELELIPISASLGYNRNYGKEDPVDGKNYAAIITALNAPLSKGSITIASANMADKPIIDPAYLRHPGDREMMIAGFKRNRQAWDALKGVVAGEEKYPGKQVQTDEQILNFIESSLNSVHHSMASCKMGRAGEKTAVVDAHARVFGVQGLRVVDASAFPFVLPGHIQATVYAFAEKMAQDILSGSGRRRGNRGPRALRLVDGVLQAAKG